VPIDLLSTDAGCLQYLVGSAIGLWSIFTARRYAKRSTCRRRVSVRTSVCVFVCVCVCVCVCVSVILQYCMKMAKRRITQIMPHDRPGTQMGCFDNLYSPYNGSKRKKRERKIKKTLTRSKS